MAKRKKARRRTTTRRRRSVGKINAGSIDIMQIALIVGGAVAGKVLSSKLETSTNAMFVKAAPFIPLALGIALPMFVKNPMIGKLSLGLVAAGGLEALGSNGLKIISGLEVIGYPGGMPMHYNAAQVAGPSGAQGLTAGTHSNFSGSRMSQINTIAGVAGGLV